MHFTCKILLLAIVALALQTIEPAHGIRISLPIRFRSEGKLTLTAASGAATTKHRLVFSELVDSLARKSVISIGYESYPPLKYFTESQPPHFFVRDGICRGYAPDRSLVPELNWFGSIMFAASDVKDGLLATPHMGGPSGLLAIIIGLAKDGEFKPSKRVVHRNVLCDEFTQTIRTTKATSIHVSLYAMSNVSNDTAEQTKQSNIISVIARVDTGAKASQEGETSLVLDYSVMDSIRDAAHELDKLDAEFTFPLAAGCSQFLNVYNNTISARSFSMSALQWSGHENILIAFDQSAQLLRRELINRNVRVWDFKENLLYYTDKRIFDELKTSLTFSKDVRSCSVLKVDEELRTSAFYPSLASNPTDGVRSFLGAIKISYMGVGVARDRPCYVFETILDEPPAVFASQIVSSGDLPHNQRPGDYIVQFYVLRSGYHHLGVIPTLDEHSFALARIVLYRRNMDDKRAVTDIEQVDVIDIYDFHLALEGWDIKSGQMFMAPECFEQDSDRRRLELAITYGLVDGLQTGGTKTELLTHNKFKLEYELVGYVADFHKFSRLHVIDYDLEFRQQHFGLSMTIADQHDEQALKYLGSGTIEGSYDMNAVGLNVWGEEQCILSGSLTRNTIAVAWCSGAARPTCTSYFDGVLPTLKPIPEGSKQENRSICHLYQLSESRGQTRATAQLESKRGKIVGTSIPFQPRTPDGISAGSSGLVEYYELSHDAKLFVVENMVFVPDDAGNSQMLKSFDNIHYEGEGDCSKMCDLDTSCRSYSYCTNSGGGSCMLSSLDLRADRISDQLVTASLVNHLNEDRVNRIVSIVDRDQQHHNLSAKEGCSIYERDYLGSFRRTDETLRLASAVAAQFETTRTTFDCAKRAVDWEHSSTNHHVAMFAYCSASDSCVLDEQLLGSAGKPVKLVDEDDDTAEHYQDEQVCAIYRRRYQTYFHVSAPVLAKQPEQQLELATSSLEECARACWNQFGQSCASFDFCAPSGCSINRRSVNSSGVSTELKQDCLHYERDLGLDELRREHLVGRHQLLVVEPEGLSSGQFLAKSFLWMFTVVAFGVGLIAGGILDERIASVTILSQSGPGASGSQGAPTPNGTSLEGQTLRGDSFFSNSIQLDVIRRKTGELDQQPLEEDF